MVKRSMNLRILIILTSLILLSVVSQSRALTTKKMRDETIRINALEITIFEEPKPEEETIKISLDEEKLYFDFDDSMVKPRYDEVLKETVKIIKNNNYKLKIYAYTDSKGTPSYNEKLSLMRAESVKSKLIQLGLDSEDLLEVKGMGNSNPIAPNKKSDGTDNPEGRALNRRIEFILIK